MKIALFGGSFDPVHREHVNFVRAAIRELSLDLVVVMPSRLAPHKRLGAQADGEARLQMCRLAFEHEPRVRVSDFELSQEGVSYSYLTCRAFAKQYPDAERYFLVGADMLEDFFTWRQPDDILKHVTLVACGRGAEETEALRARFHSVFGKDFLSLGFSGGAVSSTDIRVSLAFGKKPEALDERVFAFIREKGLYTHPAIAPALALEKPERREHSFRVAQMACARARSLRIPEEKALLAAALHDCAKYVPLSSPLLEGFPCPENVPPPVLHQYTGAYLAEQHFGIRDREVLDAIRYHTSGRAGMGELEKLVYLSDLLEAGRDFPGVETLRTLFWKDLDECLFESLRHEVEYLNGTGKEVYPLTQEAYDFVKSRVENAK